MSSSYNVEAYIDGACLNNGFKNSKGGWAYIIQFDNRKEEIYVAGYSEMTTNQRMELTALIKVLEKIKQSPEKMFGSIIIYSDSQYVVRGTMQWMLNWEKRGWERSNKKNKGELKNLDLWKQIYELNNELHPVVKWVKGHNGNKYNEICDSLASAVIKSKSDFFKQVRK